MTRFVERRIQGKLLHLMETFPIVAVTGCRQCGKSTLLKHSLPHWNYVSLEDLDTRELAQSDPRYFLSRYPEKTIFDEIQRVPRLFSYIQGHVDNLGSTGIYILSGSQNFLLMESVSQSLAGRTAILTLAPFSISELKSGALLQDKLLSCTIDRLLFTGFYPRIYNQHPLPQDFYQSYIKTYLERDLRELKNITNLSVFHKFIRLCAGRTGQILNTAELATEAGISVLTVKSWLSLLETSGIIFFLKPYFQNYGKRLIKSPKLYFYDTGLACHLLGIQQPEQVATHFLRGGLFESMVIGNYMKECFFSGKEPQAFYWRDSNGLEVDLVVEENQQVRLYEIKSSSTMNEKFFASLKKLALLANIPLEQTHVVYAGDFSCPATETHGGYISWKDW